MVKTLTLSLQSLLKFLQEQAEKILGIDSQDLGRLLETDEERYNAVFLENTFKTFNFRMRAKADTYNDETRMKHTIVSVEEINHAVWIKQMIKEVEAAGVPIPHKVNFYCLCSSSLV